MTNAARSEKTFFSPARRASHTAGLLRIPGHPFKYHAISDLAADFLDAVFDDQSTWSHCEDRTPDDPQYSVLRKKAEAASQRMDNLARQILDRPTTTFKDLVEKAFVMWRFSIKDSAGQLMDLTSLSFDEQASGLTLRGILALASEAPACNPAPYPPNAPPKLLDLDTYLGGLEGAMAALNHISSDIGSEISRMDDDVDNAAIYLIGCAHQHMLEIRSFYNKLLEYERDQSFFTASVTKP